MNQVRMIPRAVAIGRPTGEVGDGRAAGRPLRREAAERPSLLLFAMAALVIISVSTVQTYLGPLGKARLGLVFTGLGMMAVVFAPNTVRWSTLREGWPAKAVLALLFIAIGSVVFGLSLGGSATFLMDRYGRVLVMFFLLVLGIRSASDLRFLTWAFVLSVGVLVVLSLTVLELQPTRSGLGRLQGITTYDANDLGLIYLSGLPLAVLFLVNSGRLGRIVCLAIMAGIPVSLALTGSRGAFLGLAVVGPALFFTLSRIALAKRLLGVALVVGGLFVGAPVGYWDQMRTILHADEDYNTQSEYGRTAIAKRGMGYMIRYPAFGVGVGNFGRAEGTISPLARRALPGMRVSWIAPHNTYVEVGAEMGLIAFLIWLSLMFGGTVGLRMLSQRIPPAWEHEGPDRGFLRGMCLFLPISFLGFAVTSFFLSHAYTAIVYILIGLWTGVVVLVNRELEGDRSREAPPEAPFVRRPQPSRAPARSRGQGQRSRRTQRGDP